mmetsp:Transcript_50894/g.110878  ORF Transcript_50894/g.110878 Transcript_50894/m.110878 type:complete len:85 (-) Transcript_50894:916-1170(-)
MGIGVQGLADLFAQMKISFDEEAAVNTNRRIFECIYHAAVSESVELAKSKGRYSSFEGSPLSKGLFSFDLWTKLDNEKFDPKPK